MNIQINESNPLYTIAKHINDIEQLANQQANIIIELNSEIATLIRTNQTIKDQVEVLTNEMKRQETIQRVVGVALCFDMQDIQYKFGGEWENDKAFDCSAYMQICWKVGANIILPRTSRQQAELGVDVPLDQIQAGDLLIYDFNHDGVVTHIGMAMNNEEMIHTNSTATDINIVKIADWNRSGLIRAKRII